MPKTKEQIDRLSQIIEYLAQGHKGSFANLVGKNQSSISRMLQLSDKEKLDSHKFLNKLKELGIQPRWLTNGEGEMLISTAENQKNIKFEQKKIQEEHGSVQYIPFTNIDEINQMLIDFERNGRIVVFNSFPSSIFFSAQAGLDTIRKDLNKKDLPQHEFYTIESFLGFAFASIRRDKTNMEAKKKILQTMIDTFKTTNSQKELILFDTSIEGSPQEQVSGFANLEIEVPDSGTYSKMIMQAPMKGFLMIQGNLVQVLKNFYTGVIRLPCIKGTDSVKMLANMLYILENHPKKSKESQLKLFIERTKLLDEEYYKMLLRNVDF